MRRFSIGILLLLFVAGCESKTASEAPRETQWDRDMCARCAMVVSERSYAAQVYDPQAGRHRMFDDIGCVVLWFLEEQIPWADEAKIWVKDMQTQKWIDARSALYTTDTISPMGFGFGAHAQGFEGGEREVIDYEEMARRVVKIEYRR